MDTGLLSLMVALWASHFARIASGNSGGAPRYAPAKSSTKGRVTMLISMTPIHRRRVHYSTRSRPVHDSPIFAPESDEDGSEARAGAFKSGRGDGAGGGGDVLDDGGLPTSNLIG